MSRAIFHILGSGWNPLWLGSSLKAWWDPEVGITKDGSTSRVSSWIDKISSIEVLNPTGGGQPLWTAAASEMNGRNSLYFDGARVLYANGTVPAEARVWNQAHTLLSVSRGTGDAMGNGQGAAGTFLLMRFNAKVRGHIWATSGGRAPIDGATTIANDLRKFVGQRASGPPGTGNLDPILNGVSDATPAAITGTAATPLNWVSIGYRNSVPGGGGFVGHLGDQFIINRDLTAVELVQFQRWAAIRWGL